MKERLQKIIAAAGIMSRRKAEEAITAGRVLLNGVVVRELGMQADLAVDLLEVDGKRVAQKTTKKTYLIYKPRGYVTTKSDERGRQTVMEFFKDDPSLNPVGRLDSESEGLLLMTHDGDLLLRLTHPRYGFQKIYEVTVLGEWKREYLSKLVDGVELEDGAGKFDSIEAVNLENPPMGGVEHGFRAPEGLTFLVKVSEGRNRFIRRMFSALGLQVTRLKRTQMGPILLGDLRPGQRRELSQDELDAIK